MAAGGEKKGVGAGSKPASTNKAFIERGKETLSAMQTLTGGANDLESALGAVVGAGVGVTQAMGDLVQGGPAAAGMLEKLGTAGTKLVAILEKQNKRIETFRVNLNQAGVKDTRAFIKGMRRQQDALLSYGVTLEQLNTASLKFRNSLNLLVSKRFPAQERSLRKLTAVNERFGISMDTSVNFLNNLDRGFSMNAKSSDKFSRQLLQFARKTGQPFNKVFEDFNSNISTFFVELDPQKALSKFTVFQQIARRMGTDVRELTALTDKFETIEGGMEFGGNLNMLLSNLGGSFDAVQATLMSQPDRLQYITKQIQQVGGEIEGMTDLGQRAILRELSTQVGVDVGTIRAMLNKEKGGDLNRFLSESKNLGEMNAAEQRKIADENTTREQKQQQVSDQMIGKFALAAERAAQAASRMRAAVDTDLARAGNRVLDKAVPAMTAATKKLEEASVTWSASNKTLAEKTAEAISTLGTTSTAFSQAFLQSSKTIAGAVAGLPNTATKPALVGQNPWGLPAMSVVKEK
jgi:hypothetical protein